MDHCLQKNGKSDPDNIDEYQTLGIWARSDEHVGTFYFSYS